MENIDEKLAIGFVVIIIIGLFLLLLAIVVDFIILIFENWPEIKKSFIIIVAFILTFFLVSYLVGSGMYNSGVRIGGWNGI